MRELNYFLGTPNQAKKGWDFHKSSQIHKRTYQEFGFEDAKTIKTPMTTIIELDKDEQGKNVDIKLYRSMIGSLLYLMTSRPYIMFSVCLYARF